MKLSQSPPYLLSLGFIAAIGLAACSTTGNLTTMSGSTAATTSLTSGVGVGATVTSANTASGTTIASITSTNLVLNPAATATGTVSATFQNTLAFSLQNAKNETVTYTEDVGVALETDLPKLEADAENAASLANDVQSLLESWGLESTDSSEAKTESTITADIKTAATDAAQLQSVVTSLTTGTVATTGN